MAGSGDLAERYLVRQPAREVVPHDPRFSTRWHRHDSDSPLSRWNVHPEYEVHLITAGTGRCIVGDHIGPFAAGQLVLIGPDVPHHWISDLAPGERLPDRDVVLQFHDDWFRASVALQPELADLVPLLTDAGRGIEFGGATAERGAELLESVGASSGTIRLVRTLELLGVLAAAPAAERRLLSRPWIPPQRDPAAAELITRALDYVVGNLDGDVRLSVAARMTGLSDSAFSRLFRRASGQSFSQLVRRLRVAHACKLLDGTTDPVTAIAASTGYRNISNFNRQFLAETGVTPTAWRSRDR